jgi:transposase
VARTPVIAVVAVAAVSIAAGGAATFSDPRGDSGSAPDVTEVAVERAGAVLEFRVAVANMSALAPRAELHLAIDADRNAGDRHGVDHVYTLREAGAALRARRWNGTVLEPFTSSARAEFVDGVARYAVELAELGSPDAIGFGVVGVKEDDSDAAPGNGSWTFRLVAAPRLTSLAARFSPRVPRAGRPFRLLSATGTSSDGTTRRVKATCRARLAGAALASRGCRWRLSPAARGKQLVVVVTARIAALGSVTRQYRFRVR